MGRLGYTFALVVLGVASNLYAQDERVRLSSVVSGALGDGGASPAVSVSSGFTLAPHAGFEIEALYVPGQKFDRQNDVIILARPVTDASVFPTPRTNVTGRTIAFLSSFVTDLQAGRLRPYAEFGGGIANVERKITVNYGSVFSSGPLVSTPGVPGLDVIRYIPIPSSVRTTISENDLVLTAGTGLDIRVWKQLSVAADVRYLHLFQTTRGLGAVGNITRVGARVAYWF
jgi:hypothetical protein